MRHIPSLKRLRAVFEQSFQHDYGNDADAELRKLRRDLVAWRDGHIRTRDMLARGDRALQAHGIEHLLSENEQAAAYYVNTGDTYNPTLLFDVRRDRFWATTWGDWLEAEERAGNRFA